MNSRKIQMRSTQEFFCLPHQIDIEIKLGPFFLDFFCFWLHGIGPNYLCVHIRLAPDFDNRIDHELMYRYQIYFFSFSIRSSFGPIHVYPRDKKGWNPNSKPFKDTNWNELNLNCTEDLSVLDWQKTKNGSALVCAGSRAHIHEPWLVLSHLVKDV